MHGSAVRTQMTLVIAMSGLAAASVVGCKGKSPTTTDRSGLLETDIDTKGDAPSVVFPAECHTADESLNAFVEDLLKRCVEGQYGSYRAAVASQIDPMNKYTFERAWHAVKEVRIREIRLVYTPPPEGVPPERAEQRPELLGPIYCAHATITLRQVKPPHRPEREVVVLIIRENGEWRLGPPAPARLKHEIMGESAEPSDLVEPRNPPADIPSTTPATSAPAAATPATAAPAS